jgi:hypothetical protein
MVCGNCSTRNNYYHRYCYNCGAKLGEYAVKMAGGPCPGEPGIVLNKHRSTFNPYTERKSRKKRMTLTLILSAAVLFCITYFVVFHL